MYDNDIGYLCYQVFFQIHVYEVFRVQLIMQGLMKYSGILLVRTQIKGNSTSRDHIGAALIPLSHSIKSRIVWYMYGLLDYK